MNNSIYKIVANKNFFDELAAGIISRFASTCKLNDLIVLLPTKYACDSLNKVFKDLKQLPPKIHPISDLSSLVKSNKSPIDRMTLVNKISKIVLEMNFPNFNNLYAITEISEYFADIIHKIELYQINFDDLSKIIDEDIAIHKQITLEILMQFIQKWRDNYSLTRASYNNILIDSLINNIGDKTLIIAGVNSNIPSINKLLHKATHIILFGLDDHLNKDDWQKLDENHPQYNFKSFVLQNKIEDWHSSGSVSSFISHSLRSAKLCNNWHQLNKLNSDNIKTLTCIDQYQEATVIIKKITDFSSKNPNKTIMIVTADDNLMIKLILHLKLLNIETNIIRDYPLAKSKTATWLSLYLNAVLENFSIISSLALFKHPYSSINANEIELIARDKSFFGKNIFDLNLEKDVLDKLSLLKQENSFKDSLSSHIKYSENLANQDIWIEEDAKELKDFLQQLHDSSDISQLITPKEYSQLFNHFLKTAYYRKKTNINKITLAKPIDARLHSADLIILAGLNETIWPSKTAIDPCLSKSLLKKIALPSEAQQVGIEAYDFQCFAMNNQVLITRSTKINGNVTTPSRWLLRMLTLSRNTIQETNNFSINYPQLQSILNTSTIPPLNYRPTLLSVTQIEKLIFNPYHIYADLILKLKKLPSLNKELSALDFGNFIHKALEIYYNNKRDSIIKAGKQALNELGLHQPSIIMLWWPRFLRISMWFITNERKNTKIFLESYGTMKITKNFTMIARADRIELLSDESVNIIDYKTGRLSTAKSIYNGKTLQLLLESLISLNGGFNWQNKPNKIDSLKYIQLSGSESPAETLEIEIHEKSIIEQTKQYLLEIIKQYENSSTPYHYSKKKTIDYCSYAHLSRNF